jgi:hypothetical protein
MRNENETTDMKTTNPIPLRFSHSERASFTLPIQRKALQPALFPFSSKKLTMKGVKDESARQTLP